MKYCMDASALIDLGERHYPEALPIFKPIWDYLYDGIESGMIISVDYVRKELEKRADDWRTKFYGKAGPMFKMSQSVEFEYAKIMSEIEAGPQFVKNKHRDRFLSGGDPWLIALARNEDGEHTVVSGEKKSLTHYGLGAVCNELNVRHIGLIEFFAENNIGQ